VVNACVATFLTLGGAKKRRKLALRPVSDSYESHRKKWKPSPTRENSETWGTPFILGGIFANTTQKQRNCGYEKAPIRVGDLSSYVGPT
jgi:hypothetical protein